MTLPALAEVVSLPSACELEVLSCVDASAPIGSQRDLAEGSARLLRFQLSDGVSQCGAFEYRPLGKLDEKMLRPGATIRIAAGTRVAGGMLLMTQEEVEWISLGRAPVLAPYAGDSSYSAAEIAPRFSPPSLTPAAGTAPASRVSYCNGSGTASTASAVAVTEEAPHSHNKVSSVSASAGPDKPHRPDSRAPPSPASAVHAAPPAPAPAPPPPPPRAPPPAAAVTPAPPPASRPAAAAPPTSRPVVAAPPPTRAVSAPKPSPASATPAAPAAPSLDTELVSDLLATGLSLAEVHATLGLPPPAGAPGSAAAGAAAGAARGRGGQAKGAGAPPSSGGGRGRGRKR